MKSLMVMLCIWLLSCNPLHAQGLPDCYSQVDQVLWVVSDLEGTLAGYEKLGFTQVKDLGRVKVTSELKGTTDEIRLVSANLGGARVLWIQPLGESSLFQAFHKVHGDGAMSLVHRFSEKDELIKEVNRLEKSGIGVMDRFTIQTANEELPFVLMDTRDSGKYILGFTYGKESDVYAGLSDQNRHGMKLNQYAFAIRDPQPVSDFWQKIGLPELQISHPDLGNPKYYGKPADHELIQGWQRHGTIAYEWCIPVKPPIVYEDHIQKHGEGIHHLAFSVEDMDLVLEDYTSRGFVVSMGGTWGEEGKPGSGRYEYIDLEEAGGLTMELLWNFQE